MGSGGEIRDFLRSRRARVAPQDAGFPAHGDRRVAGLRREEVAQLAGVSVEYYVRLERGAARGVSDRVLDAVAGALRLDDAERDHLAHLLREAGDRPRGRREQSLRPAVRRLLDALAAPAYAWNGRLDVLGANPPGRALFVPMFAGAGPVNHARFLFLDPAATHFYAEWEELAHDAVALLRARAGREPQDRRLAALTGELSRHSPAFRALWAAYDVRYRRTGVKHFRHPVAGPLTVTFESLAVVGDPDVRVTAGTAEPGSPSEHALHRLVKGTA